MFGHHVLRREQRLPRPPDAVFPFFAEAANLEAITPAWLGFAIVTPRPVEMRVGTLIEYRLWLHGVPVSWLTRIEEWEPGVRFVDMQLAGPYRLWHHTHEFRPDGAGGTASVTVDLKPGKYEFYCPVDSHKQAGMTGTLTVQ